MSRQYAPKTFLRQIRPSQFLKYFQQRGITPAVDLELLKRPNVDPAYQWMQSLRPDMLREAETDFLAVSEMATELGIHALLRAARSRGLAWEETFKEGNHYQRAFFAFLFHRKVFELATYFDEMDRIGGSRWRRRFVGKGLEPATSSEMLAHLAEQMCRAYKKQGRGQRCHIDYYRRAEPDRHCFFAYPEDFPVSDIGYTDENVLAARPRRPAIEVVFVYRPDDGLLEITAPGGQDWADELASVFCTTVLGMDDAPPESRLATINLQVLLSREFRFPCDPGTGIETVDLREVRLELPDGSNKSVTFTAKPSYYDPDAVLNLIEKVVDPASLDLNRVVVSRARIMVTFAAQDKPKGKRVTFTLRLPEHCTLRDTPHDQIIKRCLRQWGLVFDPRPARTASAGRLLRQTVADF